MRKDPRLESIYDKVSFDREERIRQIIVQHPCENFQIILEWLAEQLERKLVKKKSFPGNWVGQLNTDVHAIISKADSHYFHLFESNTLLPNDHEKDLKPLSFIIHRLYLEIWEQPELPENEYGVYTSLKELILENLARLIAPNQKFSRIDLWFGLIECFSRSSDFYNTLLETIPESFIENQRAKLFYQFDPAYVLKDAGYPLSSRNADSFHENYLENLRKLADATPWEHVTGMSHHYSEILFDENLSFRQQFAFRLGPDTHVEWLDSLHWIILQRVALIYLNNLDDAEQLIQAIINHPRKISTRTEYLLLIVLERYYDLLVNISRALFNLQQSDGAYTGHEKQKEFIAQGKLDWQQWEANDLTDSLQRKWKLIFPNGLDGSTYLLSVLEWITSKRKEDWINNPQPKPVIMVMDALKKTFTTFLTADLSTKLSLAATISILPANWERFGFLIDLVETDHSDAVFRLQVLEQIISYTKKENFKWNSGLNYYDEVINQACWASYLLAMEPDADKRIKTLIEEAKIPHEGWNYDFEKISKLMPSLIYWYMAGVGIGYKQLGKNDTINAIPLLKMILDKLLHQLRLSRLITEKEAYLLPLRFLLYTVLKYSIAERDWFALEILEKLDEPELVLQLCAYLIDLDKQNISIGSSIIDGFSKRIEADAWIVEAKLLRNKKLLPPKFKTEKEQLIKFREFHAKKMIS